MSSNSADEASDVDEESSDGHSSPISQSSNDGAPEPRHLAPNHRTANENDIDIRGALENAFWTSEHVFEGKFWSQTGSNYAPDPQLRLEGFGHVTLPLMSAEAKALISHCKQAPFGMGEQTVIDTNVRNTWEMNASAVHIENPKWEKYLKRELKYMCAQLGVDFKTSQPRCELYKLLVYETGSHFLPHRDSIKAEGMFASMVVVLPSEFSGGAVHLSHGEDSMILDLASFSANHTMILGWFTDITHEVKPITGGYRFALSYNVIHTVQTLRPFFTPSAELVTLFRNALLSWKHREDATPFKIVVLLGHQYSRANLSGSSLKGSDAQVVALLRDLGQELGFSFGLAAVKYHTDTEIEGEGYTESELTIGPGVDLDGKAINFLSSIPHVDSEAIPANMGDDIGGGTSYKEKEVYTGNEGEHLERWYRRTVLILWPELHSVELECLADFSSVFKRLKETGSTVPSNEEHRVVDYLTRAAISGRVPHKETVQSVCHAAACWGDLDLWKRVVSVCRGDQGLGYLTEVEISEALSRFGFQSIQAIIETTLANENDNLIRFRIVEALEYYQMSTQAKGTLATSICDQRRVVTSSLKKPQSLKELPLLLDLIRRNQPDSQLTEKILSQLKSLASPEILLHFACLLHVEKPTLVAREDATMTMDPVIRDILVSGVSRAQFFEARPPLHHEELPYYLAHSAGPGLAHLCLLACLKTGNEDIGGKVVEMLCNAVEKERKKLDWHGRPTETMSRAVIVPLMPLLANTISAYPKLSSLPGIGRLYAAAIQVIPSEDSLMDFAAAISLSGRDVREVVEGIKPDLEALGSYRLRMVKASLESLVGSVLHPSQEAWRPALEYLLEVLNSIDLVLKVGI